MNECLDVMICLSYINIIILLILLGILIYYYVNIYNNNDNNNNDNNNITKKELSKLINKLKILNENNDKCDKNNIKLINELKDIKKNYNNCNITKTEIQNKLEEYTEYNNKEELIRDNMINKLNNHNNPFVIPSKNTAFNQINIKTRGPDAEVQQMGTLSKIGYNNESNKVGSNLEPYILGLYGSPTNNRATKFIYYTIFNNIKLNINHNVKSCTSEYGCNELYNEDIIDIPELNGKFKVNIYENQQLRYIPY